MGQYSILDIIGQDMSYTHREFFLYKVLADIRYFLSVWLDSRQLQNNQCLSDSLNVHAQPPRGSAELKIWSNFNKEFTSLTSALYLLRFFY